MKTIKELYKDIFEAESCDEADTSKFRADRQSKIEQSQDILELIDEWRKDISIGKLEGDVDLVKELKARIEGNDIEVASSEMNLDKTIKEFDKILPNSTPNIKIDITNNTKLAKREPTIKDEMAKEINKGYDTSSKKVVK